MRKNFLEIDIEPYKALCAAIILCAINDCLSSAHTREAMRNKTSALYFLSAKNQLFNFYASALDYDPEWLETKIFECFSRKKKGNINAYAITKKLHDIMSFKKDIKNEK